MTHTAREEDLARAIARDWSGGAPVDLGLAGEGSNNVIYHATAGGRSVAVKLSKPHREAGALGEYRKEAWCAREAARRGVATPQTLAVGERDERAYAVLDFIDGRKPAENEHVAVWRELGRMARAIHGVPATGWGWHMESDGVFGENWAAHLAYNIDSLTPDDALIALGVLDAAAARRVRAAFERLAVETPSFGLVHGDLAPQNVLIGGAGRIWLIDWGCAGPHVVPHYELNEIARSARADTAQLAAFLEGYGLAAETFAAMRRELTVLRALREIDLCRWALDRKPDEVAAQVPRARIAVEALLLEA
ncbi:MAG TPA: phosphotransferase [Rhizomicrobium sp.]|jgi:Ser/Thr protein kinase RdoA (MazF antagonist)|nr:phosphotransferase [Rhizomicrobium sp.]